MSTPPEGGSRDRLGGNAAITSIAQAAAMVSGGLLAVVVAATLGNDQRTDGFFAAFAVYAAIVSFAQSARTTVVARLLEGRGRFTAFDHYLGAGLVVFVVVSVAFGPLGGWLADLLTDNAIAERTARTALLVLWPAAGLQLASALGAAMLGALGDFLRPGIAFVAGSVLSIAAFVVLRPGLGIDALAVALLIGSVLSAVIVAAGLVRIGWRPRRQTLTEPAQVLAATRVLVLSSVSFLIAQVGYLVTIAIGARLGVGVVTVFTYAFMAAGLLQAVFVTAVPMVMTAPLARTWDRRPESLIPHHEAVVRAGLLLVIPAVAAAALIGADVAGVVLAEFTDSQITLMIGLFLILAGNAVWGLIQTVPYAAILGIGRYSAIAAVTAVVVAVQVAISFLAAAVDSVYLLAAADPISSAVSALATFLLVSRRYPRLATPPLAAIIARMGAAGAVAFGVPWLLASGLDVPGAGFVALAAGLVAFALIIARLMPAEREIGARMLALLPFARVRAAPLT